MSAFKRTAPSDEAMRVAPIQGQLGPPPLQSRRQRQTTWDNSETIRCTEDAPNNKAGFSKQKVHQCLKTGCESPTPFEKRKPCVHTHRHESLKTLWPLAIRQECFSTAADLCVAHLKDSTCVVWTSWHCIMTVVPTPSAGTPVLGTLGPSWAPQTEATRQAAVVRLSSFPSTKRAAKRGENAGNHQLRSMIFIKFYHCEISINILPSHKFFLFILHLEDHAGFLWWCQSSRSPRVQGALSAGQFTRRRRFDVTSLAQRTQPMQQLFRNSYGLVADAYL